ncbi:MAG: hypothetical protein PHW40_00940 [Candidatus Izemoplasmatales bacterium]|nr:hypothetical protein [Candidatus Izemoplasmatales bacterium]MDD5292859.1 hypothetical protein [Candidatus Izemoplasmatales bacterium]
MAKTVTSPKENVAQYALTIVQDAQTRIKEVVVDGYRKGLSKAEIERQIAQIIREASSKLPERFRESAKTSLAQNAQKWHYMHTQAMGALNASLKKTVEDVYGEDFVSMDNQRKSYDIRLGEDNKNAPLIDRFRPVMSEDRTGLAIIDRYEKRVKEQIRVLAADPANLSRVNRNGNSYKANLRNFAEMAVRYEANIQDVNQLKSSEVKFVWTSSHADASPRCSPYQGRLYSLDGSSGSIDGIQYTPLDDALLGPNGDGNGIINGYNCRHRLIEYTPGSKPPKEYNPAMIKRENAITNRQRQYERDIRNMKIEERLLRKEGFAQEASLVRKMWQTKTSDYKKFSFNNERAYFPWRTRVVEGVEQDWDDEETTDYIVDVEGRVKLPNGSIVTGRVQVDRAKVYGLAHEKYSEAARIEPNLTKDITAITKAVGGLNVGLKDCLKTQESTRRKIQDEYVELTLQDGGAGWTLEQVAAGMSDSNRYTAVLDTDKFVEQYQTCQSYLEIIGYSLVKSRNYFTDENPTYVGVNNKYSDSQGNVFELQFHTQGSYDMKQYTNHPFYEIVRKIDTPTDEVERCNAEMRKNIMTLRFPPKIGTIK